MRYVWYVFCLFLIGGVASCASGTKLTDNGATGTTAQGSTAGAAGNTKTEKADAVKPETQTPQPQILRYDK